MTYLSGNKNAPQIHTENDTKKREPKSIQPKRLVLTDFHLNTCLS